VAAWANAQSILSTLMQKADYCTTHTNTTKLKGNSNRRSLKTHLAEIINVLNYIKIKKLQNKYRVPWTDDQTGTLTINFSNGESKELSDYGMMGSFGLQKLYSLLFDLRTNQKWQKLKE
jgi:hypothetical protein